MFLLFNCLFTQIFDDFWLSSGIAPERSCSVRVHCEMNIGFCYSALSHYYRSKIHWTVCNIKETEIAWLRIRSAIQTHWMNQQYWIWCLLYLSFLSTRRCKWINHKVCDLVLNAMFSYGTLVSRKSDNKTNAIPTEPTVTPSTLTFHSYLVVVLYIVRFGRRAVR